MIKDDCIFCKIAHGQIKSDVVYSDDYMTIFKDINPQASIHLLLIPKTHYANIMEMSEDESVVLGRCLKKLSTIADSLGLENGFRLISNKGKDGCQSVGHLHFHILGGEQLPESLR